jgi:transcriptional regulator with XRE-family HTH domain
MFYTQFIKLCNEQKKEPSLVAEAIGLNRSSATAWKKGSKPKATTVAALADYFGVDVSVFSDDKRDTVGVDEDLAEYLEDLRERPETRALLEASRGMTKEQVEKMAEFAMFLRGEKR